MVGDGADAPPSGGEAGRDDVVYAFELAFRGSSAPRIEDYLVGEGEPRTRLLLELVHSDLELRLAAGEPARLAEHLDRFPVLAASPAALEPLLETELRLRARAGDLIDLPAYDARYGPLGLPVRAISRRAGAAPPSVPGFAIRDEIARGGMGVVYRARQVALGREVALKVIRGDRLAVESVGDDYRARFRREAEAVAALNHPNVVQVYEAGEADGDLYIAMELVDGPSLQKVLIERGVLEPRRAAALVELAARAVHAVHGRGIVHRDLKPDNLLIAPSGEPKVADFGLARPVDLTDGRTHMGTVVGTPEYMSPEQAALTGEKPTPAVDVYGLGAVLYACLTGRPPFPRGSVLATLERVRSQPVAPLRALRADCPRDLETICLRCLEKEPRRRYPSAADLADDLLRWLDGRPIRARRVGAAERAWKWAGRKPVVAGLAGATVMTLVAGTTVSISLYLRTAAQAADLARANRSLATTVAQLSQTDRARAAALVEADAQKAVAETKESEARRYSNSLATARGAREADEGDGFSALVWFAESLGRSDDEDTARRRMAMARWATHVRPALLFFPFPADVEGVSAGFLPGGNRLLTRSIGAGELRFRDATAGLPVGPTIGRPGLTRDACSPDGRRIATAALGGEVTVWDAETGKVVCRPPAHAGPVGTLGFSPDGRWLVSAGIDRLVRVSDAGTGRLRYPPLEHGSRVGGGFTPDGKFIVRGSPGTSRRRSGTPRPAGP
ncbi:WD40 repeat domain-containing serine/threonine protein kinase [Paludisphaera soli]|uniref:WD40 repeat domain-containing serine/threonine protein kinase n=1 Tax=Paludisphaera soli TaxID=2712865 RepID=UPI001F0FDA75|nr:serine/threonine-protein kinase [Paludisphaera soli]